MKTISPLTPGFRGSLLQGFAVAKFLTVAVLTNAPAAITYVDVNTTNTLQANGAGGYTTFAPVAESALGPGTDNLWRDRTGSTNAGLTTTVSTVKRYEASDVGPTPNENAPRLQTSVGGFSAGDTVAVYAYFWSAPPVSQPWGLSAGLTDSGTPLQHHVGTALGGPPAGSIVVPEILSLTGFANASDMVSSVTLGSGNQRLFQISLGNVLIGGDGTLRVYLDDFANVTATTSRTTLDGIGFEVVPEPTSLVLGGLGLALLARRHR